jgi:probable rRNA maturation factor
MIQVQISESLQTTEPALADAGAQERVIALLARAAGEALRLGGADPSAEMTLALSDDAQLHDLNRRYLEIDAPTDVLSFPSGEIDPDSEALYLGDVIISYERAQAQAVAGGRPVEAELELLAVHGALHLLGHDHAEEDEKAVMWALQAQVLEALGNPLRP